MDFAYLLRILARRKWLIAATLLVATLCTYVLIERRPERYKATVILSAGIVNYKGPTSDNSDAFVQQFQVENAFSNLIEFAQSRSAIKLLTVQMLRHDLNADAGKAYRQPQRNLSNYTDSEAKQLLKSIHAVNLDSLSDPVFTREFDYLLDKIARAYGYDHDAIRRSLSVKRKGETDYLILEVTTDDPPLSQYMADTYVQSFQTYYQNLTVREKKKNTAFFNKLTFEKKNVADSIRNAYYAYLFQRGLPVLGKQSEELVTRISELELQKQAVSSRMQSSEEAVRRIDQYMNDRQLVQSGESQDRAVEKTNTDELNENLRRLTAKNLETNGNDPEVKAELERARRELDKALRTNANQLGKPQNEKALSTREDLYKQKITSDLDRIAAANSLANIDRELVNLKGKLSSFVANDEVAANFEAELERAQDAYVKVNDDYIAAKLALENSESSLRVIENAQLPEWPEPNRQALISAFAGIVGATLCTMVLLLLAFFDGSLQSPEVFRYRSSNLALLGALPAVPGGPLSFQKMFSGNSHNPQVTALLESLRALRTPLMQSGKQVILFVSTQKQVGKTFVMQALAHSLAANKKKVLVLDTNFKSAHPAAGGSTSVNNGLLRKILEKHGLKTVFVLPSKSEGPAAVVDVLHNTGLHLSPSEMLDAAAFNAFLTELRTHFDFIFLEAAALNSYADARELAPFADTVIAVFNAATVLKTIDFNSIEFLKSINGQFAGSVLTQVDERNMH